MITQTNRLPGLRRAWVVASALFFFVLLWAEIPPAAIFIGMGLLLCPVVVFIAWKWRADDPASAWLFLASLALTLFAVGVVEWAIRDLVHGTPWQAGDEVAAHAGFHTAISAGIALGFGLTLWILAWTPDPNIGRRTALLCVSGGLPFMILGWVSSALFSTHHPWWPMATWAALGATLAYAAAMKSTIRAP